VKEEKAAMSLKLDSKVSRTRILFVEDTLAQAEQLKRTSEETGHLVSLSRNAGGK
jgi:hypothetical protein